ncbi:MAG: protein translocase subunit SecF [Rhodobacteraceae bacterium]|nr:protein translocase subunit SecF [Paracoccaceae bacterium]
MRLKLVPPATGIDFFIRSRATFGASVLAMIASAVLFFVVGLNFGIDFRGGTTLRTDSTTGVDIGAYRSALEELELGDIAISRVTDPARPGQNVAQVRIQAQEGEEAITNDVILAVKHALAGTTGGAAYISVRAVNAGADIPEGAQAFAGGFRLAFPVTTPLEELETARSRILADIGTGQGAEILYENMRFPQVDSVGPKVSGELIKSAMIAVILAILTVLFYIWLRFEWQFSVGAVAALVHDIVLTIGIFSLLQIRFDLAIIAALLTIVGYSLNDTVVVFDRVRENLRKYKIRPLQEVLNLSINETLSRTVMTSVTTLIALFSLFILGGDVIRGFVFAMIWGVLVGTYSSVFVASNILLRLGVKRDWSRPGATEGSQFADTDA